MDIRKIIKEEIDDFGWAENVPKGLTPEKGMTFTMSHPEHTGHHNLRCTILMVDSVVIQYRAVAEDGWSHKTMMGKGVWKRKVVSGDIVVDDSLNESDFGWADDIEPTHEDYRAKLPTPESNTPFILVADVFEDLPCGPQDYMFEHGYRWAGDTPNHPLDCKDAGIHNSPYVLIPMKNIVNVDRDGRRKFGMVGWLNRSLDYVEKHIREENPRTYLWSNIVGKSPDFKL